MSSQMTLGTITVKFYSWTLIQYDKNIRLKFNVRINISSRFYTADNKLIPSLVPPTVTSYPSGNIELRLGSSFEITCNAQGVPDPIISWRRLHPSGRLEWITENKRSLHVDITGRDMAGAYQCVANNGIEEPAVAGVNVHVNCRRPDIESVKKWTFYSHPLSLFTDIPEVGSSAKNVHTKIGYRATLECIVLSSPSARVSWFHHGVPVITDNHLHVTRSDYQVVT